MSVSFSHAHTVETDVSAEAIWSLYADTETWPLWDAEAEQVTREGPFATGSEGTMKFRGQEPLRYRLTRVEPLRGFVDETPVGDVVVRVSHRLEPRESGGLRLTYAAEVEGPEAVAGVLGPMITADFPATMASLIALARERSA